MYLRSWNVLNFDGFALKSSLFELRIQVDESHNLVIIRVTTSIMMAG